jgi:PAS domain S-box-containing protein
MMNRKPARPRARRPGAPAARPDLFRVLVEGVRDYAIYMIDPAGRVVSWNSGAQRIKGYTAAEVVGRHFSIFYPPEDVQAGKPEALLRAAAESGSCEDEGWRVRRDGSRFLASVVVTALRDPSGALTGYAKVTRDMTERQRGVEARRNLAVAREAVRARDDFLAIASHELRTPLTCVQLVVQSLARATHEGRPVTAAQVEKLQQLTRHVERLGELVSGLLDVAEMASGRLRVEAASFDLAELVREVVERFQPDARRRGSPIGLELAGPIQGRWDRRRLGDALAALVGNAVKYGGGTAIEVGAALDGRRAVVTVEDRGPGISRDDQDRVFERFERAVPVVHYGGFGVGLWTARQIVSAHGGRIEVRSDRGAGACFRLSVPLEPPA